MSNLAPLMTSTNASYITPPTIGVPTRRVACPKGADRKLLDPGTNAAAVGAGIIRAHMTADGSPGNCGIALDWSRADFWFLNPEYGTRIKYWTPLMAHWGRDVGVPGLGLIPNRSDTRWMQDDIHRTADAWVAISGRLTFWVPIPIDLRDATEPPPAEDGKKPKGKYYLRRWFPNARADNLPAPFRRLTDRLAVGPELGSTGKPQPAPFPSLVPFWADQECHEPSAEDEVAALRELVRTASEDIDSLLHSEDWSPETSAIAERWIAEAERLLGSKRFADDLPMRLELFERLAAAGAKPKHPLDVRTFARHFGQLGTLTVARGRYAGVYSRRQA